MQGPLLSHALLRAPSWRGPQGASRCPFDRGWPPREPTTSARASHPECAVADKCLGPIGLCTPSPTPPSRVTWQKRHARALLVPPGCSPWAYSIRYVPPRPVYKLSKLVGRAWSRWVSMAPYVWDYSSLPCNARGVDTQQVSEGRPVLAVIPGGRMRILGGSR